MPTFSQGEIVRVRFPYTDRSLWQARPALIVSADPVGPDGRFLWVAMITSAENRAWPQDVPLVDDYAGMGLPVPSLVRPSKIAVIEAEATERRGRVPDAILRRVLGEIGHILGV